MGNSLLDPLRALRNLSPVPYSSPGQRTGFAGLFGRSAGAEAQMRAMGTNGTLFSMVDRITTAYSQVDWHLYRKAKSGKAEDRTEVTSHAALDLWNQPNPFMSGPSFRETGQQHEELVGEQWWNVAMHERFNIPLELWPVRPDRMEPIPDPKAFISGYEYTGPGGQKIPLGLDEVFFLRRPNPLTPYRGMGAVQTILCDLDASRYSSEWLRNFFINDATPGGIIQVDKHLNDAQFNEARARWAEQHKGVRNAHRVAILENGLTWVDRAYTNKDMQFAELGDATRETIREALGFPKPMTGATDDINRSNADAGELVFARWLLVPRLMRVRALLNTRLLPMYGRTGEGLEFDFDSPVPEDVDAESVLLTARSSAAAALVDVGFDPAGTLSAVGLPDIAFTGPRAPAAPLPPVETSPADVWRAATAALTAAATTWKVKAHEDADICKPCSENDGHVYPTQAAAYADYPGGKGYVKCLGKSNCRCTVVEES